MARSEEATRLAEIRERLVKASMHPWFWAHGNHLASGANADPDGEWSLVAGFDNPKLAPSARDADLIAHAPEDIEYLLGLLAEAEAYAKEGWDWLADALAAGGWATVFDIPVVRCSVCGCRGSAPEHDLDHQFTAPATPAPLARIILDSAANASPSRVASPNISHTNAIGGEGQRRGVYPPQGAGK